MSEFEDDDIAKSGRQYLEAIRELEEKLIDLSNMCAPFHYVRPISQEGGDYE